MPSGVILCRLGRTRSALLLATERRSVGRRELDHFSFLETTAEISVTLAGFVSIFVVLARRAGSFRPDFALAIRSILISSIACLFFAALPLVLAALGLSGAALWRFSSAAFFLVGVGVGFYMGSNMRGLPADQLLTIFVRIGWSLAAFLMLTLVANITGWPLPPNAGVYLVSVWLLLGIASLNFLDLVFRGVLGESAT